MFNSNAGSWTVCDVGKWLKHIEMPGLVEPFKNSDVNGKRLLKTIQRRHLTVMELSEIQIDGFLEERDELL